MHPVIKFYTLAAIASFVSFLTYGLYSEYRLKKFRQSIFKGQHISVFIADDMHQAKILNIHDKLVFCYVPSFENPANTDGYRYVDFSNIFPL